MRKLWIILPALALLSLSLLAVFLYNYTAYEDTVSNESLYETQIAHWSDRLSQNARTYTQPGALVDAYSLADELQSLHPPDKYMRAHMHLYASITLYTSALEAYKLKDEPTALRLIQKSNREIQLAQKEVP